MRAPRGSVPPVDVMGQGRTAVFELLVLDPDLRDLVGQRASSAHLKAAAERKGMVPLKEAGCRLVREGVTTTAEVTRVIEAIEEAEL